MREIMNDLYKLTRLFVNYFQPSFKLKSKVRDGGHVTKRYDKAQTPCQRLLQLDPDEGMEQQLNQTFMSLNPVELLSNIEALQLQLDATTKEMLNIPESTEVHEFVKLLARANTGVMNEKIKRPNVVKNGRKSIVSDEVARDISFLMHQDPSLAAMGLLPLLSQRYPGLYGNKQRATLARQIKLWREQHLEYERFYPKTHSKYAN